MYICECTTPSILAKSRTTRLCPSRCLSPVSVQGVPTQREKKVPYRSNSPTLLCVCNAAGDFYEIQLFTRHGF